MDRYVLWTCILTFSFSTSSGQIIYNRCFSRNYQLSPKAVITLKKSFCCCFLKQDLVVFSPGMPQLELATFLLPQLSNSGIIDVRSPVPHRSSTVFPTDVTQSFRRVQSGCGNTPCALWGLCIPLSNSSLLAHAHMLTLMCPVFSDGPAVQCSSCLALAASSIACQASEVAYFFLWVLETHRTSGLQPLVCVQCFTWNHLTPFFWTLSSVC